MYQPPVLVSHLTALGAGGGAATLAYTGLNVAHGIVAAATLVFFGFTLLRLVPRREA